MDELTTKETATLLGVDGSTVRRYADANLLVVRRTPGGHRRYTRASVEAAAQLMNPPTPS